MIERRLIVYYDDVFLKHYDPSSSHPEGPERLNIAVNSIKKLSDIVTLDFRRAIKLSDEVLLIAHSKKYVEYIKNESRRGFHYIDSDTYVNEHTYNVALTAFSTSFKAVEVALSEGKHVLVLPRPPGHHAGINGRALGALTNGFCIFNNSAAAALAALRRVKRVLVIDFDAHHGNGTQEILWNIPNVVHVDIHERGIYPGTGFEHEVGGGEAKGTKINIPIEPYSTDHIYAWVINSIINALIDVFKPEFVVVSAGFDAYVDDPLTDLNVTEKTYEMFGFILREMVAKGKVRSVVTILEGGYSEGLRAGLPAYLKGFYEPSLSYEYIESLSNEAERRYKYAISSVISVLRNYWNIF